jgi:hypothetical protein
LDVAVHLEEDPRLQVVYTVAPDMFNGPVPRYLERLGALVLPWAQAVRERFDLALAASYNALHELHAPLLLLAHGAGHGKRVRPPERGGPIVAHAPVYGLDPQRLVHDGRVVASTVVLSHHRELDILRRQCPEAVSAAVVAGDPCYDRIRASLPHRDTYRRALGLRSWQKLVLVTSTWGRDGVFGRWPELPLRLLEQLPADQFRVGMLLHPAIWAAHGHRQVRAWLRECLEAGLLLLDPTEDWRGMVVAADRVIGDHGSTTAYAAAIARPVHMPPDFDVAPVAGSPQSLVAAAAPRLDSDLPIRPQLNADSSLDPQAVAAALTARPGDAATVLRTHMYRLLCLPEPERRRQAEPVPTPRPLPPGD